MWDPREGSLLTSLSAASDGRRIPLILDNCELVVQTCGGVAEAMLQACPGLHSPSTSRQP